MINNAHIKHLQKIDSAEKAFLLFRQILSGYSFDVENNFYIKHANIEDFSKTLENSLHYEKVAKDNGLISTAEKLNILFKNGSWTKEQEDIYQDKLKRIEDLKISKKKLIISSQIASAEKILEEEIRNLYADFEERERLLGLTIENFCAKKNYEFVLRNFFFKDEELREKYLPENKIEDLSPSDFLMFYNHYADFLEIFSEMNLKKITVCPSVMNMFFLSETPMDFYGLPISKLTMNQSLIYGNYKYYKNISSSPDFRQVPQEYYSDLQKIVNHYDQQYSILLSKAKSKK